MLLKCKYATVKSHKLNHAFVPQSARKNNYVNINKSKHGIYVFT